MMKLSTSTTSTTDAGRRRKSLQLKLAVVAVFLLGLLTAKFCCDEQTIIAKSFFLSSSNDTMTSNSSLRGGGPYSTPRQTTDNSTKTAMTAVANRQEKDEELLVLDSLRNSNIVFLGDSVMRFQYMTFIYYLHHHRHIAAHDVRNNDPLDQQALKERQQKTDSSGDAIDFTSVLLSNEHCDCYRPSSAKFDPDVIVDNRYYYQEGDDDDALDATTSTTVAFVQKYGSRTARGHWNSTTGEIYNPLRDHASTFHLGPTEYPWIWEGDWEYVIRNHLAPIFFSNTSPSSRPQQQRQRRSSSPSFLIWNAGNHPHDLGNATVRESIFKALQDLGIVSIYKTTTYLHNGTLALSAQGTYEDEICQAAQTLAPYHYCMNMSWTQTLNDDDDDNDSYFDHVHLTWEPNRRANIQLLSLLRDILKQHQELTDGKSSLSSPPPTTEATSSASWKI